jgi:L-asparagine oxygenase
MKKFMTQNLSKKWPFHFLNEDDVNEVHQVIQKLTNKFQTIENNDFQDECAHLAQQLPESLKKVIAQTKVTFEDKGYLIVSGFSIDDEKIGDSPASWDVPWDNNAYLEEEVFQCLLTAVAGRVFGWRTQENGRFLRHITPMKKDAMEQLGGSSKVSLLWHTEEAFHPARASLFTLMC